MLSAVRRRKEATRSLSASYVKVALITPPPRNPMKNKELDRDKSAFERAEEKFNEARDVFGDRCVCGGDFIRILAFELKKENKKGGEVMSEEPIYHIEITATHPETGKKARQGIEIGYNLWKAYGDKDRHLKLASMTEKFFYILEKFLQPHEK